MTPIEYVVDTLQVVQEENESDQSYLQRVAVEIQALDETGWDALPGELQNWYNDAAEILTSVPEDEEPSDLPPLPEGKKSKKGRPKKVVEEGEQVEVKEKKEKKVKEPKEPKERGPIAANVVRQLLCENMDLSLDEILEKLPEHGVTMQRSSMQVVALNTVRAFEMVMKVGEVKDKEGKVLLKAE